MDLENEFDLLLRPLREQCNAGGICNSKTKQVTFVLAAGTAEVKNEPSRRFGGSNFLGRDPTVAQFIAEGTKPVGIEIYWRATNSTHIRELTRWVRRAGPLTQE